MPESPETRFRHAYAAHRAKEGRAHGGAELEQLPYLTQGPLARQWAVRARTFDAFMRKILRPQLARHPNLLLLDVGAGNCWLARRVAGEGARAVAVDFRDDAVDGLGAASAPGTKPSFDRVAASFAALPLDRACADVVVFNASLHYALDLAQVLGEARRVARPGGRIVILDSPFYKRDEDGRMMVAEKRRQSRGIFGEQAEDLLALPVIDYLTRDGLLEASAPLGLTWRRHRVRHPLWYTLRPLKRFVARERPASRFELWEGVIES